MKLIAFYPLANFTHLYPKAALAFMLMAALGLYSCNNEPASANLPALRTDTLNVFALGDSFTFHSAENSCCTYGWLKGNKVVSAMPDRGLIELVSSTTEDADPDCAGCSSYTEDVFRCVKPGRDTLYYMVIPNGRFAETVSGIDHDGIDTLGIEPDAQRLKDMARVYIIEIK
jgi:hypothetical protein